MNFESLIGSINQVQDALQAQAAHAVNLSLTARNWLVGYYIVEFEQQGEDRAKYGENLLNNIAKKLSRKGLEARRLREYRQFYRVYFIDILDGGVDIFFLCTHPTHHVTIALVVHVCRLINIFLITSVLLSIIISIS